jgi:glycosyltransferase involved in cell wall biosynthesis
MNQESTWGKVRVVVISGTLETSLHPVPPVADGAPEWNVFRLVEAAAADRNSQLEIHVISPCEAGQREALRKYPVYAHEKYHHIIFTHFQLNIYRRVLRHILPLRLLVRRLARLPDLLSWLYLWRVMPLLEKLSPDIVFINARPQYIRYVRKSIPARRLYLMMRGPLGESSRALSLLDGIIVNSGGMKSYAGQFIDCRQVPVWEIPNTLGDDFRSGAFSDDRFTQVPKKIIFAGRIVPEKGVIELLEAFELIRRAQSDVELYICGAHANQATSGSLTPYEHRVGDWVRRRGLGAIHLEGYVPNSQLGEYYSQAALAVFPSRNDIYTESFGMVALEAMRCGTPVVASRQPGFEELILPGETGLLVDNPRDIESLASAILQILRDSNLAQRMGKAGYQRSLNYNPDQALIVLQDVITKSMTRLV